MSSGTRFKEGQVGMQLFRPPDVRNGPAADAAAVASLRGPPVAGLLFASAQMRGGFPVDYGPRVDSPRSGIQMSSRSHQRPFSPKSSDGGNGAEETPPSRHLWVGNVSAEVTESLLMERFSKFGPVERVAVYSQRNYAFVNFRNLDSAKDAKAALQGVTIGGLSIRIEFAKGAKQSRHLWVGGICQTVSREQIEGEFKNFGVLEDFKFLRDRNCAFVDFVNIEDAIAAVDTLNGKRLGNEDLRVDFGRSMPPKRDVGGRPGTAGDELGDPHAKFGHDRSDQGRSATDSYDSRQSQRASGDSFRGNSDGTQATGGQGSTNGPNSGRSRSEKEEPSDVLWVGFPLLSKVDETGLRRAFMPYGEVERVKTFPGRTYAFVQFKNVEEATRARNALNGKLFNDPRVHIRFSNSEIGPVETPRSAPLNSPSRGRDLQSYSEKPALSRPATGDRFQSMISPLHPTGLRPEYYPGGLARGAALARVTGNLPSLNVGRNVGRSLGSGASDERVTPGLGGIRNERNLPVSASGLGGRSSYRDQWELDDEMIGQEPKRLRAFHGGGLDSANEGGRWYPEAGRYSPALNPGSQDHGTPTAVWNTVGGGADDLGKRSALQKIRSNSNQFDVLPTLKASTPSLSALGSGAIGMANHLGKRDHFGVNIGVTGVNEGWRWHGTIAKGGTPVCRAQCLPVGKGIDVTVPDVVNCTARTDLDMLAKHVHQAGDFGVVFFVPEADPDVPPYRDFMHYLGEKHRAGVAKLADGTTLFLVPPSEFSERVLKVPGNNCLFGVVLKSQPPGPGGNPQLQQQQQQQQQQPSPHIPLQQSHAPPPLARPQLQLPQQFVATSQQISQSHGSGFVSGSGAQDNGTIQAPNGTFTASQLSSLANGLPGGLTPDLLVSLSALLPRQNQSAAFPPPPLSISGSSASPSGSRDIGGTSQFSNRGPNAASPVPPSGDSKGTFRSLQNTQQPPLQSHGWSSPLVDQQHLVGGPMSSSSEQRSAYGQTSLLPPGPPQSPHVPSMQQHQLPGPIQEFSGAGYNGQTFSQHPRSHTSATTQLGSTPVLPSDQLSQLTALLTQRQQQPAQQQQVAQLLHQHYQQQQPQQHAQESPSYPPPQGQGHSQQTQPSQYAPAQQQWAQGGPNLQPPSSILAVSQARGPALQQQSPLLTSSHAPMPPGGGNSVWDMGLVPTVQQQQQQAIRPGQVPSPTPPLPIQLPITQNQLQPQVPPGDVGVDQGGSAGQDDGERQKRFQATLQLAAALLQQMQNQQQNPRQGTADQR